MDKQETQCADCSLAYSNFVLYFPHNDSLQSIRFMVS